MKLTMLNVCLSSIELRTWIVTILTNFMYPKSLLLRMGDEETLCQRFVIGFRSFFSCKTILELCNMVIFEKQNYSISVWPKNKTRTICLDSPTLQHTQKVTFNTPNENKTSPSLHLDPYNPKLWINNSKNNLGFILWESFFKF